MFIDTLGSGTKDVVGTTVGSKESGNTIRPLFGDEWVCIHSMSPKPVADAHVDPIYAKAMVVHNHTGPTSCGGSSFNGDEQARASGRRAGIGAGVDGAGAGGGGADAPRSGQLNQRVVILVNTKNCTANVTVAGAAGGT
jgi:hypothetical protein